MVVLHWLSVRDDVSASSILTTRPGPRTSAFPSEMVEQMFWSFQTKTLVDAAVVNVLASAQHACAPTWIEMAQNSPECGCRSLDMVTICGAVPVPVTSVFAPKTLLTCSYAEEAATTTSQPVAPLVTTTITSKNKYQCHEKAMQMTPPPKKRKRGRAQNENKPKGETYLFCLSGGMIQPKGVCIIPRRCA